MSQKQQDTYKKDGSDPKGPAGRAEGIDSGAAVADEPQSPEDAAGRIEKLTAELEQARAEAEENKERFLRAKAETENVRRRAELDVVNAHKYAIEKFAAEILNVRDSLELARSVDAKTDSGDLLGKMLEGVDLTLKQLDNVFEKFDLRVIDPQGERFDPERHQAMSMVESDEVEPHHVVTVVQKGAMLTDRLLRPALVIIAKARSEEKSTE